MQYVKHAMDDGVEVIFDSGVLHVVLARPAKRNAFNERVIAALSHVFTEVVYRDDVRVVVLRAQGTAFCAGADLTWMQAMANYAYEQNLADATALAEMLAVVDACPKLVVAQVQGDCFAGGVGLLAVCDVVFAVPEAKFGLTEVRLGLIPATIAPYVGRAVGMRMLRRYALSGEVFTGDMALHLGLVHELVDASDLEDRVEVFCRNALKNSLDAVQKCKALLDKVGGEKNDVVLRQYTAEQIAQQRASEEGKEGVGAFLEKRQPNWVK
jgi:methylglutaconyl-CoA hydratase